MPPLTSSSAHARATTTAAVEDMRCIAHIDMDCFYAQVEAVRLGIDCRVTPLALAQWGSLIAVNYPARARGVKRFNNVSEALNLCSDLVVTLSPSYRMGESVSQYHPHPVQDSYKISLEPYRRASRQIFAILASTPGVQVEKGSVDEAYVDVTEAARRELEELRAAAAAVPLDALVDVMEPSTRLIEDRRAEMEAWLAARGTSLAAVFDAPMRALLRGECGAGLVGSRGFCVDAGDATYAERCLLLCAASRVVWRMRQRIYAELRYDCSAGIAHNRVLAKCISATHKPNQQTLLLPDRSASALFVLPLSGLRGFGGKFGAAVSAVCGGATECREAWLVPLAQLRRLDGTCEVGGDDADGGEDGAHAEAAREAAGVGSSSSSSSSRAGQRSAGLERHPSSAKDAVDAIAGVQDGTGVYTYTRIRGYGSDAVTDPALPRAMDASKVFHPVCTSWSAAQLWMAPLAGELWHRFREYESHYQREGRQLVVSCRTYVAPDQARRGQRSQAFRRQVPLPNNVQEAFEIAGLGLREFVKLMREATGTPARAEGTDEAKLELSGGPASTSAAPPPPPQTDVQVTPTLPARTLLICRDPLPMPPLHFIAIAIIGLRLCTAADADASAAQRSLTEMFAAMKSPTAAAAAKTTSTAPTSDVSGAVHSSPRKRSRQRSHSQNTVIVEDVGDDESDAESSRADVIAADAVSASVSSRHGASAKPSVAVPPPPPRRTLADFFHKSAEAAPSIAVAASAEADVELVNPIAHPQASCVSITEVSSGEED